jgi:hypothetical protein
MQLRRSWRVDRPLSASAADVQLAVDPLILLRPPTPSTTGRNRVLRACLRGCRRPSVPVGTSPLGRNPLPLFPATRTNTLRDTLAQWHRRDCWPRRRLRQGPIDDGRLRRRRKGRRNRIWLRNNERRWIREPLRSGRDNPICHQKNDRETAHGCTLLRPRRRSLPFATTTATGSVTSNWRKKRPQVRTCQRAFARGTRPL